MAEIPGIVWFFVGVFVLVGSFWFGTNEENIKRFSLFIAAGVIMILVGVLKMIGRREESRENSIGGGRFCSKCGAALGGSDRFCPGCGSRA